MLFIFAVSINQCYGFIGVFPIDTFAFFDSAHFINKGYLPIRDYWTSNGFLVDILQSLFFYFLGVNWNAYLFHSSLINSIFVIWIGVDFNSGRVWMSTKLYSNVLSLDNHVNLLLIILHVYLYILHIFLHLVSIYN